MTTTKGLLECTTQGVVNLVLYKLHFGVTIHPGVSIVKRGLWSCAKGQPCSEHTPPPPEPRAWVMIGDLQEQFTGSQGRLAADTHFEPSQAEMEVRFPL